MKTNGGVDVKNYIFLTTALMEVSDQLHDPAALLSREEPPSIHYIGGWISPRTGQDDVKRRKTYPLSGFELRPLSRQKIAESPYKKGWKLAPVY
jgi:hypothetical protein